MDIAFQTTEIATVFNRRAALLAAYGEQVGSAVSRRMAVLAAAPNLSLVPTHPPIRCRAVDQSEMFSVDLPVKRRLLFLPRGRRAHGASLAEVTAIEIVDVQ